MSVIRPFYRSFVSSFVQENADGALSDRGPILAILPSVFPLIAQVGMQVSRRQGTYVSRGGGTVSFVVSEWRVDGVTVGTGATYLPVNSDEAGLLSYSETAVEVGGTLDGSVTRNVIVGNVQPEPILVPDPFGVGMWNLSDPASNGNLSVTIESLPENGGRAIIDVEYSVDEGPWESSNGLSDFIISGLENGVLVQVQLRGVNVIGAGLPGDTKSATPTNESVFSPASVSGLSSWIRADTAVSVDAANMVTSVSDVRDINYPTPIGAPALDALAACAIDTRTGELLYWKNPSYAATPASVTKSPVIADALRTMGVHGIALTDNIAMEAGDFETPETTPPLDVGDTLQFRDLMYLAMLQSSNAAARCVARVLGRHILSDPSAAPQEAIEAFIADLTVALKADGIGGFLMESASGVFDFEGEMLGGPGDSDHIATAKAVADWAQYSHETPGMDAIWGASDHTYTIVSGPNTGTHTINNLISMVGDVDIFGAKGGALPGLAGKAIHGVAALIDGRKVAISVLQSSDREGDARSIINYCDGVGVGSGQIAAHILPGNGVNYRQEGSTPAPALVSDVTGFAFDFGSATDSTGPYLRADIPDVQTLLFVWDREVSQIGATVWEAYMDIWGGAQPSERITTDPGTNGWWTKPNSVTLYKNGTQTDALLPFERCVVAITDSSPGSIGIFGAGRSDEFRNISGKSARNFELRTYPKPSRDSGNYRLSDRRVRNLVVPASDQIPIRSVSLRLEPILLYKVNNQNVLVLTCVVLG